ncbi:MAG: hypothetical protein P8Y18_00470 [Candidatus Bathyarchaeota archaeon]
MGFRTVTVSSVISLCLIGSLVCVVFASSNNWVEVTRFAEKVNVGRLSDRVLNVDYTTESFSCNNVEWRIRWNFSPPFVYRGDGERRSGLFSISVYQDDNNRIDSISYVGTEEKNGTWVHNENGTFHLHISALFAYDYSIIVEQNIDSIPEFTSLTFLVTGLSAVLVLLSVIYRTKIIHRGKK